VADRFAVRIAFSVRPASTKWKAASVAMAKFRDVRIYKSLPALTQQSDDGFVTLGQ
jgi:hypothetical protein